jgi:hypothetical protein
MVNTIQGLSVAVITFVVAVIIFGIGSTVLNEIEQTQCDFYWNETQGSSGECLAAASGLPKESLAINASEGGQQGVETFADWLPTIAVILASALIIGMVSSYFYMRGN